MAYVFAFMGRPARRRDTGHGCPAEGCYNRPPNTLDSSMSMRLAFVLTAFPHDGAFAALWGEGADASKLINVD